MILCGRAPRHLFVANRICETTRTVAIVHEREAHWNAAKLKKLLKPGPLWSKGSRWIRDRGRYRGNREAIAFFGSEPPRLTRPDLVHEVPHINHPELVELARRLQPDVIAVFGTSLIRGPLLREGRLGIVNLHGGLSPHYRGADCTFWALYNGEPEQVGCTLHFIDAGIDTGKLIAHVCPEVKPGDDELTLFWRAVRDSAELYSELFERMVREERLGCVQSEKGRLYQVRDRKWRHERRFARKLRDGLLEQVDLPSRTRWFALGETPE